MSKKLRCRPSDLYAITGSYRSFIFDRAVVAWGIAIENAIESVEEDSPRAAEAKRQRVLDRWLGNKPKYREPMASRSRV